MLCTIFFLMKLSIAIMFQLRSFPLLRRGLGRGAAWGIEALSVSHKATACGWCGLQFVPWKEHGLQIRASRWWLCGCRAESPTRRGTPKSPPSPPSLGHEVNASRGCKKFWVLCRMKVEEWVFVYSYLLIVSLVCNRMGCHFTPVGILLLVWYVFVSKFNLLRLVVV